MSSLHLTVGSEKPAAVAGYARLYGMKYCPYTHRIRLVLSYKKIPHDIVNINLKNKPEWYFQIHPAGKVPAFVDVDGKVIVDSMIIANYLDEKYPEPPLYREITKDRDLELIENYAKITSAFSKCIHNNDTRPLDEIIADIASYLVEFEDELAVRGTTYFGGNEPSMLDILMWPWAEQAKVLFLIRKEPLNFDKEKFSRIIKWRAEMKKQPFVQENEVSYEKFAQLIESLNAGKDNFDNI